MILRQFYVAENTNGPYFPPLYSDLIITYNSIHNANADPLILQLPSQGRKLHASSRLIFPQSLPLDRICIRQ